MNWISVEEQTPPRNKMIIMLSDKGVGFAQFNVFGELEYIKVDGKKQSSFHKITHWMNLPEPPYSVSQRPG
ncbi:DUF551 domain-containing protein [Atlantibacter subterraneus]|uniref:DUF551 domain-containing protein n=1 Tax=Atlantibacter subterraneus TaxID=255519 RepID=UPI002FDDCAA5